MTKTEEYAFLWNGSEEGWALMTAPDLTSGYCIFNYRTKKLLHIDDEELNAALCKRMQEAGCEILDDISPSPVGVEPQK
jgi:hypothetical protein